LLWLIAVRKTIAEKEHLTKAVEILMDNSKTASHLNMPPQSIARRRDKMRGELMTALSSAATMDAGKVAKQYESIFGGRQHVAN